ncbi:MAG: MFS transporter [Rhodospirillales bacterium]|nr:MFS transporter [Rhodospirillales bacterium]
MNKKGGFRWFVIFLLFYITVVNYIDRSAIAFAIGDIQVDLGLDTKQIGLILGAFGLGYAVTTFLGGIAVDRWGARLVLLVAAILWSGSIGITGLAMGFATLYVARTVLGIAEGPNFPALTGAVGRWLAPHERAIALGNTLVAVPVALAIGAPVVTQLIAAFGWRGMFYVLTALSVLWIPLWLIFFRNDPKESRFVGDAELSHIHGGIEVSRGRVARHVAHGTDWRFLLTNRTLVANNWAFFVFGYFLFFFMTWLPNYLSQSYHLNVREVGLFSILPWVCAAVLLVACGYLSDYLLVRTGRLRVSRSLLIAGSQLLAALAVLPIAFVHDLTIAIICITAAVAFSMSANAAYYAVNVDVTPDRAATSLGIMDTGFALSGFLAPTITGWVVATFGSFADAFLLLVVLAVASVVVVLLFHRPDEDRAGAISSTALLEPAV